MVTFITFALNISYRIDLTLLSIAIVFPLVFTIRGSFRKKEKALEHLSKFRSALKTVHYYIMINRELSDESKDEMTQIIYEISDKTMEHLKSNNESTEDLDDIINNVQRFMQLRSQDINKKLSDRVFRFMKDLHESIENLHAINIHRTPISLKAYCKLFIYIFPLIYAPSIIDIIGLNHSPLIAYFIVLLTEFILISLYNIQDQLEYPFDDVGLDDINLDNFKINR